MKCLATFLNVNETPSNLFNKRRLFYFFFSTLSLPHLSASMVPVYSVSKKAARAFSESLRSELIKDTRNIKITVSICKLN